jgi:cell division septum initiation protein DivIVA
MALDRQSIERRDFPVTRRGYNPEAVHAHLGAIAAQLEELTHSAERGRESIADAAGEQVRAIIEAAEATASRIRAEAEEEATRVRADARSDAQTTQADAADQAGEQLELVSKSATAMLDRIEVFDRELTAVFESMRSGAARLNAELDQLRHELKQTSKGGAPRATRAEAARAAAQAARTPAPEPEPQPKPEPVREAEPELVARPEAKAEPELVAEGKPEPAGGSDDESARLIALNMALNGSSREEVDRYLRENYELADQGKLVDDVFASVEG